MIDPTIDFVRRALKGIEDLPIEHRADLYDVASNVLRQSHPEQSGAAEAVAKQLREASALQMTFAVLMSTPTTEGQQ